MPNGCTARYGKGLSIRYEPEVVGHLAVGHRGKRVVQYRNYASSYGGFYGKYCGVVICSCWYVQQRIWGVLCEGGYVGLFTEMQSLRCLERHIV